MIEILEKILIVLSITEIVLHLINFFGFFVWGTYMLLMRRKYNKGYISQTTYYERKFISFGIYFIIFFVNCFILITI